MKKSLIAGLFAFFSCLLVTQFLAYQQFRITKSEQSEKLNTELGEVSFRLKETLGFGLSATNVLASIVERYGVPTDFDELSAGILQSHKYIDAVELTQKGVITHVYPLQGNEEAMGLDVLNDSLAAKEAFKAIEKGELFFAGPLELRQGGIAVIGRLPIYREKEFFGFSVVIIKLSTLLGSIGINNAQKNDFSYQLSKVNPLTLKEEFFLPVSIFKDEASVFVEVPDGEWKLTVSLIPEPGFHLGLLGFSLLGLAFSLATGLVFYQWAGQPEKLRQLVDEKTSQLIASEIKSKVMLERISDAFIAFDSGFNYAYTNKKADQIFDFDTEKIKGRNIWRVYPELIGTPVHTAFLEAMSHQKYVCVEFFFSRKQRWLENHLYPSSDGLSLFIRDITVYKEASEKLEASEKYFRALIENSSDAIVLLDASGKVIYQSPSTDRISGYSLQEIQKLDGLSLIHPDDRAKDSANFARLAQNYGQSLEIRHRFKHKNGNYMWIEGTYVNLLNQPHINAVVYNYHDVTERMMAQQAIAEEKFLSDSIINSLPGIFYLYGRDLKFVKWNKNFETVSGYSAEEISTMQPLDFYADEDKELLRQKIESVFKNGKDEVEASFYTKTNQKIPYYFNGQLTRLQGNDYLLGMGIDITEKVMTEKKAMVLYKEKVTVLNRINDGVVSLDREWRYRFINDAALATHPVGREATIGKTLLEVHPEMDGTVFWKMYQEALLTMTVMETEGYYEPMRIWFCAKAYPSDDGITIFYRDITDQKRIERETLGLINSLQARNKDLQQFSYIVSHNLRAPIANILSLVNIMDDDPKETKKLVELINGQAMQLDQVVRDINLIISTRSAGSEDHEVIQFEKVLDEVKQELQAEIAQSKARLTSDFSQWPEIDTLKSYVSMILYNLISNAIKYRSPDVPLHIHVQASGENQYVCLSVKDNGRGIDLKKNESKIFGLYKRFHSEDGIPGRGVGLNMVKTSAEALGGWVELESGVNKGSIFKVYLPKRHGALAGE